MGVPPFKAAGLGGGNRPTQNFFKTRREFVPEPNRSLELTGGVM